MGGFGVKSGGRVVEERWKEGEKRCIKGGNWWKLVETIV